LTIQQHYWIYLWPPLMLSDFALGAVSAELAATTRPSEFADRAADFAALAVGLAVLLAPNPRLDYRAGLEPFFDHALAPLFAAFLAFAAVDAAHDCQALPFEAPVAPLVERTKRRPSRFAAVCSHAALDALSECSFEVYLFQWPLHKIFADVLRLPTNWTGGGDAAANSAGGDGENFVAFILALWTTAALYEKHLERPWVAFLRKNTTLRPGMVPLRLQLDEALNVLT